MKRSHKLTCLLTAILVCSSANASERNSSRVRAAFQPVIREARKSTAWIFVDKKKQAYGTVISADGYILTKASELKGEIECMLYNNLRLPAKVVGTREDYDLAMLKVDSKDLIAAQWSDDTPKVGDWLATPTLNSLPLAVGVASVAPRKIRKRNPAVGIIIEQSRRGPLVNEVVPDSGGDKAGVKAGDLIFQINKDEVTSRDDLINKIRKHRPGDTIELKIMRGEKEMTLKVVLGELAQLTHGRDFFQNSLGGKLSSRRCDFPNALQHDSVLQPSQCGGPLVNLEGKIIGVNIARASRIGSYAIPASAIKPLLDELKAGKKE